MRGSSMGKAKNHDRKAITTGVKIENTKHREKSAAQLRRDGTWTPSIAGDSQTQEVDENCEVWLGHVSTTRTKTEPRHHRTKAEREAFLEWLEERFVSIEAMWKSLREYIPLVHGLTPEQKATMGSSMEHKFTGRRSVYVGHCCWKHDGFNRRGRPFCLKMSILGRSMEASGQWCF